MDKNELIQNIRIVRESLKEERESPIEKIKTLNPNENLKKGFDRNEIEKEVKLLIKELYMTGHSREPCPKCGGTGHI